MQQRSEVAIQLVESCLQSERKQSWPQSIALFDASFPKDGSEFKDQFQHACVYFVSTLESAV